MSRSASRGSDMELAYASPNVVRLRGGHPEAVSRHDRKRQASGRVNDETGKEGPDGRKRRYRGSSDDEGKLTYDGFTNEDLRVGGPYLCSLPAQNVYITKYHPLYSRLYGNDNEVWKRITEILQSSRVALKSFDFVSRQSRWIPGDPLRVTAFIIARREAIDNSWLDAARKIRQYLISQGLQEVCVEIADKRAFKNARVFPVLKEDAICTKWETVRQQILRSIELKDVFFVGCYRVGQSEDVNDNPPTILILVNVLSTRDWKGTRETVVGILGQHDLSMVAVEISKDRLLRTGHFVGDLDRAALEGPVKPGYSIGIQADNMASGTFGGYIDLKRPNTGEWVKFGLTCFHCVVPEPEKRPLLLSKMFDNWTQNGVPPKDELARRYLRMHSPSLKDLEQKLRQLDREIAQIKSTKEHKRGVEMEAEGLLDMMPKTDRSNYLVEKSCIADLESCGKEIRAFRDTDRYELGYVVSASGFKTCKVPSTGKSDSKSNMDWALIEVQKRREGPNKLGKGIALTLASSNDLNGLSDEPLFIEGRSSGSSEGAYSGLRPALITEKMVDGIITRMGTIEHSATGYNGESFSRPGDSGSLIFQRPGKVGGMVFARAEQKGITLFTRIDDLFEDIKQSMSATDIRISD
ncbi:hypothetical protein ATEIFO6365_0010045400 [Aspergillus terreus]|uniref:Uncharacterized protein n=1 Tax=Aspergillus terreus TaxID=33178 RepID=A0A5M3ZE65_ASPTE|nr:hypothetical protein ATETN484_0012043600 [Aspergillus terreus]GFF19674.1 hypothetical protein ATEIFO6365_0010045400 [Aspergillus terreus]